VGEIVSVVRLRSLFVMGSDGYCGSDDRGFSVKLSLPEVVMKADEYIEKLEETADSMAETLSDFIVVPDRHGADTAKQSIGRYWEVREAGARWRERRRLKKMLNKQRKSRESVLG